MSVWMLTRCCKVRCFYLINAIFLAVIPPIWRIGLPYHIVACGSIECQNKWAVFGAFHCLVYLKEIYQKVWSNLSQEKCKRKYEFLVFWCFQGASKETSDMKLVNLPIIRSCQYQTKWDHCFILTRGTRVSLYSKLRHPKWYNVIS